VSPDPDRAADWKPAARERLGRMPGPRELRQFTRHLVSPTRASAVRGLVDGVFVAWTLRRRGVQPLISTNERNVKRDVKEARRVAEAVDAGLGVIPMAPTCLRRSVTLVRELGRLELGNALHIGVRHVDHRLEAHAWVQVGDVVVNDDPNVTATYAELASGDLERLLPLLR